MAKKAAPTKGKPKGKPAAKPKAEKKKPARNKEKPKEPRAQRLLDDMPKDRVLDAICLEIHDGLVDINDGTTSVKNGKAKALARMEAQQRPSYIAHGVRLMYTPGGAKVSAKLVDSDEGEVDEPAGPVDVPIDGDQQLAHGDDVE